MPQPTSYDRQVSFAAFSAEFPTDQHSGVDLDIEFNAVKRSLDETLANIALIQDDDGALARGSVGRAQLDSSIAIGIGPPAAWAALTAYDADVDAVFYANKLYLALETHTSGASFDASKWTQLADFSASAAIGAGDVTESKIAASAVTTAKIADGAVTTAKLAAASVTLAKLDAALPAYLTNVIIPAGLGPLPFAGFAAPSGWLFCYGQAVSRATYPALYAAVGDQFGAGDGSTTFNVPDMRGRAPAGKDDMGGVAASRLTTSGSGVNGVVLGAVGGAETIALIEANLASHTHSVTGATSSNGAHTHDIAYKSLAAGSAEAPRTGSGSDFTGTTASAGAHTHTVTGTAAAAGSGLAHNNTQPTIIMNFIIKAH